MRAAPRLLLVVALGMASAFLVACGDRSHLLSSGDAQRLSRQVDSVSSAVDAHQCGTADRALGNLRDAIGSLPDKVDRRLRGRLNQGADRLGARARDECQRTTTTQTDTTPTTSVPTDTTPTDTTTTQTDTTTTQTDTTTVPTFSTTTPTTSTPTTTQPGSGGAGAPGEGR